MKIQPNATPAQSALNFGNKRANAKLPNELRMKSHYNPPKGLLVALFPFAMLVAGTIIWRTSDYYELLKQFEQLMKDIKKAEIRQKDSAKTDELPADTITMADAVKLNKIG